MLATFLRTAALVVLAVAIPSASSNAQDRPNTREGFWFNAGLGYGSVGCERCASREYGLSGQLALGGSLSPLRVPNHVASETVTVTVVPAPTPLSIAIVPPWAVTMRRAIAKPSPVPSRFVE